DCLAGCGFPAAPHCGSRAAKNLAVRRPEAQAAASASPDCCLQADCCSQSRCWKNSPAGKIAGILPPVVAVSRLAPDDTAAPLAPDEPGSVAGPDVRQPSLVSAETSAAAA